MNSPRARSSEASRRRIRSNARASWPTSSSRAIDDRLVEVPGRDPLGCLLEPPQAPREQARAGVPDEDGEQGRDAARDEQPAPHDADGLELRAQGRGEQDDGRLDGRRHLGELLAVPRDDAPCEPADA